MVTLYEAIKDIIQESKYQDFSLQITRNITQMHGK